MSFSQKFDFPLPDKEELDTLKLMAKYCSEELDGRDLWVLKNFAGDSQRITLFILSPETWGIQIGLKSKKYSFMNSGGWFR